MKFSRAAALAAVALLLQGCGRKDNAPRKTTARPVLLGAEDVVRATTGRVVTGPVVSGVLEARDRATLRAQIAGSLAEVHVRAGQSVRRGEILARIRAVAERQAVASGEAAVRTAQTQLKVAENDAARTEVLVKAGALAERDLEQARSTVETARASVAEAEARLAASREDFRESTVRAPIGGVVNTAAVLPGDVVSVGAELFTIVDPATLELRASIPAENIAAIRPGTPVLFSVQGYPGRTFRGSIRRIVPAADPETRQVDVYASVPNDAGILVAGLYAQGRVGTGNENAVMLPGDAVRSRGESSFVLKLSGGKAVSQQVTLGVRDDRTGNVQIASGVEPGETVLVGAAADIRPGAPVELRDNPTAGNAPEPGAARPAP